MTQFLRKLLPCKTNQAHVGERYHRLVVTATGRTKTRRYFAICDCDCGRTGYTVLIDKLKREDVKSCGCLRKEQLMTHGQSYHPLFDRWQAMMSRCYGTNLKSHKNYRDRGIFVCERWHDPTNFIADMYSTYDPKLQLDRIDNDGPYSPENTRWVTPSQNNFNRSITHKETFRGKTMTLDKWEAETGIPRKLLAKRLYERGWSVERALTTPVLSRSESAKIANAASHK